MNINEQTASTVIVGLGKTGLSVARFLLDSEQAFVVMDSRQNPPAAAQLAELAPNVEQLFGDFDADRLLAASRIVLSPGVSLKEPAIAAALAAGIEVIGDIELFARSVATPVIAITGSNGKTTVTSLLGDMAKAAGKQVQVGGNIGKPALELIGAEDVDLYVLELSSFQLELTVSLMPVAATVLNISADHMDRYDDIHDYTAAKRRIFFGNGIQVVNGDDPQVLAMTDPGRPLVRFGSQAPAEGDYGLRTETDGVWLCKGQERLINAAGLALRGRHNLLNALAALALAESIDLDRATVLDALRRFKGLPHRCQLIASADGIEWVNDSKATNVGATVAALDGLADNGQVVLIAGGLGKGADFSPLAMAVEEGVRCAILFGADAATLQAAIEAEVTVLRVDSLEQAVDVASAQAQTGDTVLLSPACASMDMFENYEQRGDEFARLARLRCGS